MGKYQIVACLLNPLDDEYQLKGVVDDYKFITNKKKNFQARVNILSLYPIKSNVVEEHNSTNEYLIEEDADGVYLLNLIEV